jgi:hypothetical protein
VSRVSKIPRASGFTHSRESGCDSFSIRKRVACEFCRQESCDSIATLAVLAAFGAMTFVDAPRLAANLLTPWVGVWERINIGVFLVWVVVLAVALLGAEDTAARTAGRPALAA